MIKVNPKVCKRCARHNLAWMATARQPLSMIKLRYRMLLECSRALLRNLTLPCPVVFFRDEEVNPYGYSKLSSLTGSVPRWCPYAVQHKYEIF